MRYIIGIIIVLIALLFQVQGASATILTNGGFESGTANWTFYTNGTGSFTVHGALPTPPEGVNQANVSITTAGTNVQLYQYNINIENEKNYTLNFSAYSNTGHDMKVSLLQQNSPYNPVGLDNQIVSLGTGYANYSYTFTGILDSSNTRLRFKFADYDVAGDKFYIDDVYLYEVTSSTPDPTNLTNTTGNGFESAFINFSWNGTSTGYNIWINDSFMGYQTAKFRNSSVAAHTYQYIRVYGNNSGVLSNYIDGGATVANNDIVLTDVDPTYSIDKGTLLTIDANFTDGDGDNAEININTLEVFTDNYNWEWLGGTHPTATGILNFTGLVAGTYNFTIFVTDWYSSDSQDVSITVNEIIDPPIITSCLQSDSIIQCIWGAVSGAELYQVIAYES